MSYYGDSDGSGGESYDEGLEEIRAAYGQRYHESNHNLSDYDDEYGNNSSDSDDSEESNSNDEELKQFFRNFHRGGNYDEEINSILSRVTSESAETAADNGRPADWEERKASSALANLKVQLQDYTRKISPSCADVGLLSSFVLRSDTRSNITIQNVRGTEGEPVVSPDQSLNPYWTQLSNALSQREHFQFHSVEITKVQLTKEIIHMLGNSLRGRVRNELKLRYTNLCGEGIKSLSTIVEHSPDMSTLQLCHNTMDDLSAVKCLSRALKSHTRMSTLCVTHCNIGDNVGILSAILESDLEYIDLGNNDIGSAGAVKISEKLETNNPTVRTLALANNKFNDDDAIPFARALKKNTNLRELNLEENNFTSVGVKSMFMGLFDSSSLNALSDSNHTCTLRILGGNHVASTDGLSSRLGNGSMQAKIQNLNFLYSRRSKIMMALHSKESLLRYLTDVPVEYMPDVLGMIQAEEEDRRKLINMIYATMRWWNMPSLYSFTCANNSKRKRDSIE